VILIALTILDDATQIEQILICIATPKIMKASSVTVMDGFAGHLTTSFARFAKYS